MVKCNRKTVASQVEVARSELASTTGLPFRELLNEQAIRAATNRSGVVYRKRVFSLPTVVWAYLSQITSHNSSCQQAVKNVLADRVAHRHAPCSTNTSSFCAARQRLPEQSVIDLTREVGQRLHAEVPPEWLWRGRRVHLVDGSTMTMADTEANQQAYPQSSNQKPGLGFPIMRFVVLISLGAGTVTNCAMNSCRGKGTGEQNLFRQLQDTLKKGEIVVGDRHFDNYRDVVALQRLGVDCVFGKSQARSSESTVARVLGSNDCLVEWTKPNYDSTRYSSKSQWESLPANFCMRELRCTVRAKDGKPRNVVIVTTLLDAKKYPAEELLELFRARWHCELDLRSIKQTLGMSHSRCESPEMVRKDLWMHLLAYNLIRVRMAQAATLHQVPPRTISFKGAATTMLIFGPHLHYASGPERMRLEREMLAAIARDRVGNQPHRTAPRALKKRKQKYKYLTQPRDQISKGVTS